MANTILHRLIRQTIATKDRGEFKSPLGKDKGARLSRREVRTKAGETQSKAEISKMTQLIVGNL